MSDLKERDPFFDALKGLAIIAVLFIHTPYTTVSEYPNIPYFIRHMFTFAVNTFFFCSGYFCKLGTGADWQRFRRLLAPYVIWTLPFVTYAFYNRSYSFTAGKILSIIFCGGGFGILYFLSVLMQLALLRGLLSAAITMKKRCLDCIIFMITPLYILIVDVLFMGVKQFQYHWVFPAWVSFYYFGMMMRNRELRIRFSAVTLFGLLIVALFLSIAETAFWLRRGILQLAVTQVSFSSFFYSAVIILLLVKGRNTVTNGESVLCRIGTMSFGIFLMHIPMMKLISYIMVKAKINALPYGISTLLEIGLVLLICIIVIRFALRLIPLKYARLIGLV